MLKPIISDPSPFGLNARDWKTITTIFSTVLPEDSEGTIYLFGSRANETSQNNSDLDLLLSFSRPLTTREIGCLRDAFEDSSFRFKTDLVDSHAVYPPYQSRIDAEKVALFVVSRQV